MPFNGSGTFQAPSSPGAFNPAVSGSSATPEAWNALLDDIETALSTVICKDGQSTPTADIPMANRKITNLGDATTETDALNGRSSWRVFDQQDVIASATADFIAIPSTVNNLMAVFELRPSANGATIALRTYDASGNLDTGASDYYWNLFAINTAAASSVNAQTTSSIALVANGIDNTTSSFSGDFTAANIQAATFTKFNIRTSYQNGANGYCNFGNGVRSEADRITGVRFFVSSGTMTGKITLFVSV